MLALSLAVPAVAVRQRTGGPAQPAPPGSVPTISRPLVALTSFWNLWGDSTTFGVGALAAESYPAQLRTLAVTGVTAGSHGQANNIGAGINTGGSNGNAVYAVGNNGTAGETTPQIAARVTALAADASYAAEMARPQIFSGGLNNYNTGSTAFSTTLGYGRDWPARVKADLATQVAAIGGAREWFHILAPASDVTADGARYSADHVAHRRDMIGTHGRRILNFHRYARDHGVEGAAGYAARAVNENGAIPPTLRGAGAAIPAYNDAAPIVVAGVPTDLNYAEGQFAWNTALPAMYRKLGASGSGSWQIVDVVHFSGAGYALKARMVADAMMAAQGDGPPHAAPQEFRTVTTLADGGTLGQVAYTGTATAFAITTDRAGTTPSTRWQVSAAGLVTRKAGAPALGEGMHTVWLWATNAYGTLRSVIDIYVDRPAASAPARFNVGGTGVALYGRDGHGFANGTQISGAALVRVATLADAPFLVNMVKGASGSSSFFWRLNGSGFPQFGGFNAANASIMTGAVTATSAGITAGVWTWLLFSLDLAAGTSQMYVNDAAKAWAPTLNGGAVNFADTSPQFYAARSPAQYDDGLNVLKGGFGPLLLLPGYVDWSIEATRRQLFDASGNPVARTPFSAVGGVAPKFDTSGGYGNLLWGPANPADAQSLVIPSWRARQLVSVAP